MPPDDPNPTPPPRTFTQDELNTILAKETRPLRERATAAEDKLAEYQQANEALKAASSDLQAQLSTLTAERDQLTTRLAAVEASAQAEVAKARGFATEALRAHHVSQALIASKVFTGAIADAATIFRAELEMELDERGAPDKVIHDGKEYPDLQTAASVFLASRPHFTTGAPGGTGTRAPNTSGAAVPSRSSDVTSSSPADLAAEGWAQSPEGNR